MSGHSATVSTFPMCQECGADVVLCEPSVTYWEPSTGPDGAITLRLDTDTMHDFKGAYWACGDCGARRRVTRAEKVRFKIVTTLASW